jgi:hypothetical protein
LAFFHVSVIASNTVAKVSILLMMYFTFFDELDEEELLPDFFESFAVEELTELDEAEGLKVSLLIFSLICIASPPN